MSWVTASGRREDRVVIAGREYTLATPRIADWLHMERELRRYLGGPLRRAAEQAALVPPEQWSTYWQHAHRAEVEWRPDLSSLLASAPSIVQTAAILCALMRQHHPDMCTIERCLDLVEQADGEQLRVAMDTVVPPDPALARPTTAADAPS